ncbi:MAG: LysR family transcriptional regulator [Ilumatobacteraceae bacterium]
MGDLRELDIRHLIAFDAVATEGTFARAASKLGYTQSAVSQQIAALERIVGDRIFDRPGGPRPVELTPLGAHLLEHGRELLAHLDVVSDELDRFRSGDVGRIRIGTFQSVSNTLLPLLIGPMRSHHRDLDISVFESDYDDVLDQQLINGELDLSFVVGEVNPAFEAQHLLTDPFCMLTRPGQFPPGPVSVGVLHDEPLVGQHQNSCQLINESGLRSLGIEPNYVFRSNDNGAVAAMVRAGMGVAVLPLLCVDPEDPRIEIHALDPSIPDREVSIAWRADRTLSPAAERFVELAVQISAEVAERFATSARDAMAAAAIPVD